MGRPKKNVTNLTEVKIQGEMKISRGDRIRLLEGFNRLKDALLQIEECNDLFLSDIRNLNKLKFELSEVLNFVPTNKECHYYCEYKLGESK